MRETHITKLRSLYARRRSAIRRRLLDFSSAPPAEYFYEMLYCLMTPQTSAEHADKVVQELKRQEFQTHTIDPEPILRDRQNYIRFHKTKSKYLLSLKNRFSLVLDAILTINPPSELRDWLVEHVQGLGYKEATHFLRNIGKNGGLAILDRHILRNLRRYGVIRSIPKTLLRKRYLMIESQFTRFSKKVGIPVDELDLLFWSMETGQIRK